MRCAVLLSCCLLPVPVFCQDHIPPSTVNIPLVLHSGTPLRLTAERTTFPKRVGDEVRARLAEPLYAFDTMVVPAGAEVVGHVDSFSKASRNEEIMRCLRIHFGSFRRPHVRFETIRLPDGASIPIQASTEESTGQQLQMRRANSNHRGRLGQAVASAKQQLTNRLQGVGAFVHSSHKWGAARDAVLEKSPYRPATIKENTRWDAVLDAPVQFGTKQVPKATLARLGASSPQSGVIHAAVEQPLDSAVAQAGSPVEAIVTEPLFSGEHRLILPEGSRLKGKVTVSRRARFWHRNGHLRFAFTEVVLPPEVLEAQKSLPSLSSETRSINGNMTGMEVRRGSNLVVDSEGAPVIKDSATRFIAPAFMFALATVAGQKENENGRLQNHTNAQIGTGAVVLGVAGMIIGRTSQVGAMAMGYTGAAQSVYSHFIGRGSEVRIAKNTSLLIQLGKVHQGPILNPDSH